MPGADVQVGGGRGVGIVGEAVIAVIEITTWIAESDGVPHTMGDVSIIGKAITENNNLAVHRCPRGKGDWNREENHDTQNCFHPHNYPSY